MGLSRMKIDWQVDDLESVGKVGNKVGDIFQGLEKYTRNFRDELTSARVRIMKGTRWGWKVIFDMNLPGKVVHADGKGDDLVKLANEVKDQARRQIEKYKAKLSDY